MGNRNLDYFKKSFSSVGWFIPSYVNIGFLDKLCQRINDTAKPFDQSDLESILTMVYSAENLAAMVTERFPITPYLQDYKKIIAESVQAHFLGLNHIAAVGLMPVIEGAGKKLAKSRLINVERKSTAKIFTELADHCKDEVTLRKIGAVGEIVSMMDSFIDFIKNNLYIHSDLFTHSDKTNRHGILHGTYSDIDYGKPINFYKAIASVEFLTFVASFRASISFFAPDPTERSQKIAAYYTLSKSYLQTLYPAVDG